MFAKQIGEKIRYWGEPVSGIIPVCFVCIQGVTIPWNTLIFSLVLVK